MRVAVAVLLGLIIAASARGHIVPVLPSTCAFDPLIVEMPATGLTAITAPAAPADAFRILYDPQASVAQFDLRTVPPRSFATTVRGTVSLSGLFGASLRDDGDLAATPTFAFATDAGNVTVQVAVTTGLVAAGDTVLEGAPIGADGRFTWVGVAEPSPLGPPLAGGPLAVRLGCQLVPVPDMDQFRLATRTKPVSASLGANVLRGRFIFTPGAMDVADFPGRPALVRVSTGDTTLATAELPAGLLAHGKNRFVGRNADERATLGARRLRRSGGVAYLLAVKLKSPSLPAAASGAVPVQITYDVGGLLSRAVLAMHVKRHGMLLRFP